MECCVRLMRDRCRRSAIPKERQIKCTQTTTRAIRKSPSSLSTPDRVRGEAVTSVAFSMHRPDQRDAPFLSHIRGVSATRTKYAARQTIAKGQLRNQFLRISWPDDP